MAITISGNGITSANIADGTITTDDINASDVTSLKSGRKNLIINGAMQVAQRGTSGSVLGSVSYGVDRFYGLKQTGTLGWSQVTDAPDNFKNSLKYTNSAVGTGFCQFVHRIEGQNISHLGFGSSAAQQITLSFYVKSSITGTYSFALRNGANDRSYVTTYTINSANTWERKTITITGDTTGTWTNDNTMGANLVFGLGSDTGTTSSTEQWTATGNWFATGSVDWFATNGATWQITGVQLELGDTATDFEHRSYGEELALCQRYYQETSTGAYFAGTTNGTSQFKFGVGLVTSMRVAPTLNIATAGTKIVGWHSTAAGTGSANQPTVNSIGSNIIQCTCTGFSGLTDNRVATVVIASDPMTLDAEL